MAQETEIRVRIDDQEATSKLREMLDLVEQISGGLGGIEFPSAGGAPSQGPTGPTDEERAQRAEERAQQKEKARQKRIVSGVQQGVDILSGGAGFNAGGFAQSIGRMITQYATTLPSILGVPLGMTGVYGQVVGRSLQERQKMLGDAAQLETLEAAITGSLDTGSAAATKNLVEGVSESLTPLGFGLSETARLLQTVSQGAGLRMNAGELQSRAGRLAAAERAGIPAGVLAATAGAIAQATGASVGAALDQSLALRNLAEQSLDLRGSGVTGFLQSFSALVDQFTQQGIKINVENLAQQITGIARATGTRGERPAQILSSLIGFAGGAGGEVTGALQGFATSALTAEAARGSTDLFGFLQNLENLQKAPITAARVISGAGGGGRAGAALLASISGIGTREAGGLARATLGGLIDTERAAVSGASLESGLQLSGAFARTQRESMVTVRQNEELGVKLIEISGTMQDALLRMSGGEEALTAAASGVKFLVDKVADLIETVQRGL